MNNTGMIFDISHYMLEDGPGIRTNVFVKGCPLRCKWCSNVYGLGKNIQLSYDSARCAGCGACVKICPESAIRQEEPGQAVTTDFEKCKACLACVEACPNRARKSIGRICSAEEVYRDVEKDRMFYRRSQGGVTMSGGEILMQPEFATAILKKCSDNGIDTAVETSGFGRWEDLKRILYYCSTAFMDCKCMDSDRHKELTGVPNEVILANIEQAAAYCNSQGITLIVRLPLIPGMNDDEENISATAEFVKNLKGDVLLNILPYHNYGVGKYAYVGKTYELEALRPQTREELKRVQGLLDETGVRYSVGGYNI